MPDIEEEANTLPADCSAVSSSSHLKSVLGLLVLQVIYAACSVLAGAILAAGIDPNFLVYTGGITSFVYLAPLAAFLERRQLPDRLSSKLMAQLLLISIGGTAALPVLALMGIQRTSPAISAAMFNLSPGLIFLIACCLGLEKFDAKCRYSATKAGGTLLCLGGVIAMTLLQQDVDGDSTSSSRMVGSGPSNEWITGCVYLIGAVFIVSCSTILHATALVDLPAPLSLTAITALMGAIITGAFQLLSKGKLDPGRYNISTTLLATYILLICAVSSMSLAFQMWCILKHGPVFVSMFGPIGTVTSAILSAVVLGKFLSVGSLAGVFVMIIGFYIVLWAKRKENILPMLANVGQDDDVHKNGHVIDDSLKKAFLS